MTQIQLNKYFEKINMKRNELIEAQSANDKAWTRAVKQEINLLIDLCFYDDNGNLLCLGG